MIRHARILLTTIILFGFSSGLLHAGDERCPVSCTDPLLDSDDEETEPLFNGLTMHFWNENRPEDAHVDYHNALTLYALTTRPTQAQLTPSMQTAADLIDSTFAPLYQPLDGETAAQSHIRVKVARAIIRRIAAYLLQLPLDLNASSPNADRALSLALNNPEIQIPRSPRHRRAGTAPNPGTVGSEQHQAHRSHSHRRNAIIGAAGTCLLAQNPRSQH